MQSLDFTIFYVADVAVSARFYASLLGREPIDASPAFVMFAFDNKAMFGLWNRENVIPKVTSMPCSAELTFMAADETAVDAAHASWVEQGFAIAQQPTAREFGYSTVVLDPDGHRIRMMKPNA